MHGRVKWFNDAKGYGFIAGEDGRDYFCHYSEIKTQESGRKTLKENQTVVFEPREESKGPRASAIVV